MRLAAPRSRIFAAIVAAFVIAALAFGRGAVAQQDVAAAFARAKFRREAVSETFRPGLFVIDNLESVQKNARAGKPMKLADGDHVHGLYCHATSRIRVRLPGKATLFTAVCGLDTNEQTSGGRGSVRFHVEVDGKDLWRSEVLREGMTPVLASVALDGRNEFFLVIDEGGDGIACDQSDWAEAKVTLEDGRLLPLEDLPISEDLSSRMFFPVPPLSFVFGGRPSAEWMKDVTVEDLTQVIDADRVRHQTRWNDPKTRLVVTLSGIEYTGFPVIEYAVTFKNTGIADTPILENVHSLDFGFERGMSGEWTLHHATGSLADGNDYQPLEQTLGAGANLRFGGFGGRPTNTTMSYFNADRGDSGVIVAVGWPGQWAAEFTRDLGRGLTIRAGQETTHFTLHPGEEVRAPSAVLLFWRGDWIDGQNVWRRWMRAFGMPRPGGKVPEPTLFSGSGRQHKEMIGANEKNQIEFIDRYREEKIPLEFWWMDAGWYVNSWGWPNVGTWEVDRARFPNGLRAVSDHAHALGMKTLLWFEPERVTAETWIAKNHPEWVNGGAAGGLFDFGNDAARRWMTDHVDQVLSAEGIDLYRQDFNMDPLEYWRRADPPDRQGITEAKHVAGVLAFWDELKRRRPGLLIDACASGGRRNDIESMRRAVPLWRSDYAYEVNGHQCMTYGISFWLPFHGTGTVLSRNAPYYGEGVTPVDPYAFWSNAAPGLIVGVDVRERSIDYPAIARLVADWRTVSAFYAGDFYPLTPWTRDDKSWMAWHFDRPEEGAGVVQAFRRDRSIYESARFPLRGLDPAAVYEVQVLGRPEHVRVGGRELTEKGLLVTIPERPGAVNVLYRKVP